MELEDKVEQIVNSPFFSEYVDRALYFFQFSKLNGDLVIQYEYLKSEIL